ncbi:MAG: S1C family serine protease, partial [Candidatus Nitrosocosmicus sp.]
MTVNFHYCSIFSPMFVVVVVLSSLLLVGINSIESMSNQNVMALENQKISNTSIFDLQTKILNSIFNQVKNSVVQITSKVPVSLSSPSNSPSPSPDPSNPGNQQNATALGSGFVYDNKGHVITNYHVVSNSKIVDVTFIDGNRYTASVIGKDPSRDLAVLKIIENLTKPLVPLTIVNSSNLSVGEQVIAIGNPYGLDNTLTT